ncbi:hypothetical protein NM688_g7599 [Phlebia brevispora]|uniref:Uncharacterized protein n=1 Tax=Phlebia brevispora TaxID=194682 RepID=A0ACC1S3L0_9APHY|nr:hypothetical protein NM688_g7599 [Phlebia brevispora]
MDFVTGSSSRPMTPPPRPQENLDLTPEQVKRIAVNRLKAKARQREKEQSASSSSDLNANKKRPLAVVPDASKSPTGPKSEGKLKRDSRLGKYFEYDLSKMVNSKGGFLVEEDKEADDALRAKERERERERAMQNMEPTMFLDPKLNPKCRECGSVDIDATFQKVFGCLVCNACKNSMPEKYSLLTKTECKEDYLLTDAELRDHEIMPHLLKANPHKSTFANMMLFLRYQVEDFAWKKWGSPEALDAEWEKRVAEKKKKKKKKFEESLKELRRRTRETVWQKRKDAEHKHVFGVVEKGADGIGKQPVTRRLQVDWGAFLTRVGCSAGTPALATSRSVIYATWVSLCLQFLPTSARPFTGKMAEYSNQVESRAPADALEVEQLDYNLYRSKRLWIPFRSRGVFGGQVISQAVVSATNCVNPAYGLHSLHCYFLLSASPAIPILYHVDRVRDGRSYATRAVRAVQKGRTIFIMLCSFQRPEPWQPIVQWPMPGNISPPEQCPYVYERAELQAAEPGIDAKLKAYLLDYVNERKKSFLVVKHAGVHTHSDGAKYISYCIGVASRTAGLDSTQTGPKRLAMSSSLDHSIFFYNDDFDCGDWLLYVITAPSIKSGRGVVYGRMYTRDGKLVAVMTQEGVVRADIRDPSKAKL